MGCGNSKITVVDPSNLVEGNESTDLQNGVSGVCLRGDSAMSKGTADSGLGLYATDRLMHRKLPPLVGPGLTFAKDYTEKQKSHEILEQLFSQGLLPTDPSIRASGEAYSVMVEGLERPLRRPPPRLESLKTRTGQPVTKEDIEAKMRKAEERRKEEELKRKLRAKSARHRHTTRPEEEHREEEEASPSTECRPISAEVEQ